MTELIPSILVAFGIAVAVAVDTFAVLEYRKHRAAMARLEAAHRELDRQLAEGERALAALSALASTGGGGAEVGRNKAKLEIYRARLGIYRARAEIYKTGCVTRRVVPPTYILTLTKLNFQ